MTDLATTELTADEARELTSQIKGTAERMYSLLLRAHEGRAWSALGYESWRDYAMAEFGMSQSHAYRLLDQARVIREIEAASDSPMGEIPNERQARELLSVPEGERAEVWRETVERTEGRPTAAAVREVSEEQKKRAAEQRDAREHLRQIVELGWSPNWPAGHVEHWTKQLGPYDEELKDLCDRAREVIGVLDEIVERVGL